MSARHSISKLRLESPGRDANVSQFTDDTCISPYGLSDLELGIASFVCRIDFHPRPLVEQNFKECEDIYFVGTNVYLFLFSLN